MTVREVAAVLGVTGEAVKKHIRELWPELMRKGECTYLTKEQVTEIKQKMRLTTKVASALTSLDMERMTVREVAAVLGVSHDTITRKVQELFPGTVRGRVITFLSQEQATAVKMAITSQLTAIAPATLTQNCVSVAGVTQATTLLEKQLIIQQAMRFQNEIVIDLKAEIAELEAKAAEAKPKVDFFDTVAASAGALSMREAAAVLNMPGWGRNKVFALLREKGVLDGHNIPYREYQERGYFRVVERKWTDPEGEIHVELTTLVYQRGIDFIRQKLAAAAA